MLADKQQYFVAMVDDDALFIERVAQMFEEDPTIRLFPSNNYTELTDILEREAIDCIVVDYDLGDDNGFRIVENIRASMEKSPPMIMLTGGGGERTAIKAFRSGLSDYIPKRNLSVNELISAVKRAIAGNRNNRASDQKSLHMGDAADYDGATGFYSRAFIGRCLADLKSSGANPYGVVIVRIAHFQEIKRQYGLAISDQVFRAFVLKLRETTRDGDIWGRITDASFIGINRKGVTSQALGKACERLSKQLAIQFERADVRLQIKPAIGAALSGNDTNDARAIVKRATQAAKKCESAAKDFVFDFENDAGNPQPSAPDSENTQTDRVNVGLADRRRETRRRVLKKGHILSDSPMVSIDCIVRNLSKHGAALRFSDYYGLPQKFTMKIVGDGGYRPVALRWQSGQDAGVEYLDVPKEDAADE